MTAHSREQVRHLLRRWAFREEEVEREERPRSFWKTLSSYWMRFARILGKANTILLLTVAYFLVIGPGALLFRLFGKDLLERRAEDRDSYWYDKTPVAQDLEQSKHQF